MNKIILIILLFLTACAHQDEWTTQDTVMQVGVTAVLVADAITTSRIKDCPNCFNEGFLTKNILGPQPEKSDTFLYFGTVIAANYFISRALPKKWRPYWQTWEMSIHGYSVSKNCKLDLC